MIELLLKVKVIKYFFYKHYEIFSYFLIHYYTNSEIKICINTENRKFMIIKCIYII